MTAPEQVTRFEVIDHRADAEAYFYGYGRVYEAHKVTVELSYQDDGRTLKVFVTDRALPPRGTPDGGDA